MTMLIPVVAMHRVTNHVTATALVIVSTGVHHNSPTSCLLFFLYISDLNYMIKLVCSQEIFLE